jgi:GNAT superfamily N-acetyltransferase
MIVIVKELDTIVEPKEVDRFRIEDFEPAMLPQLHEVNRAIGAPDDNDYFDLSVERGFHAFVAFADDKLVGWYWWVDRDNPVAHPDLYRLGRGFELRPGDVYGASFFLVEEYRGGGRAGEFLFWAESTLRDRGYKRIWGYVDSDNRPARWLYATRGYVPTRRVHNRRFAFLRWRKSAPVGDES